jgi:hypothetical protein
MRAGFDTNSSPYDIWQGTRAKAISGEWSDICSWPRCCVAPPARACINPAAEASSFFNIACRRSQFCALANTGAAFRYTHPNRFDPASKSPGPVHCGIMGDQSEWRRCGLYVQLAGTAGVAFWEPGLRNEKFVIVAWWQRSTLQLASRIWWMHTKDEVSAIVLSSKLAKSNLWLCLAMVEKSFSVSDLTLSPYSLALLSTTSYLPRHPSQCVASSTTTNSIAQGWLVIPCLHLARTRTCTGQGCFFSVW